MRDHAAPLGTCRASGGKIRWPSRDSARHAKRKLLADGKAGKAQMLGTYRCPACGAWHVGHRTSYGGSDATPTT